MLAKRPFSLLLSIICACASFSFGAEASPKPSLAVTALSANNVDSSTVKTLTDALADELLRTGAFRVLERSQMEKILAEQGFQQAAGCEGGDCAIRMGKLLGIDRIIVGSVGSVGAAYVVTAREVDVATGEILVSAKRAQKGKLEDLLLELVPQIAKDLAGNPPHNPYLAHKEKRSSKAWLWWTAGAGVAAAGGAAAYVVLASDDGGLGGDPVAPPSGETTMKVTW